MRKNKIIAYILFFLSLLSPIAGFALACTVGESDIYGIGGIVRYSWLMWFLIPVGILSILSGKKLKQAGQKYVKNYIAGIYCLVLLITFGSYRFLFSSVTYDAERIAEVEQKIGLELPKKVKIATYDIDLYTISNIRIIDDQEMLGFEDELKSNELWKTKLDPFIKNLLPHDIKYEMHNFECFVFFNETSNEYNTYPSKGEWSCVFIAYDKDVQRLIILDKFNVNVS